MGKSKSDEGEVVEGCLAKEGHEICNAKESFDCCAVANDGVIN